MSAICCAAPNVLTNPSFGPTSHGTSRMAKSYYSSMERESAVSSYSATSAGDCLSLYNSRSLVHFPRLSCEQNESPCLSSRRGGVGLQDQVQGNFVSQNSNANSQRMRNASGTTPEYSSPMLMSVKGSWQSMGGCVTMHSDVSVSSLAAYHSSRKVATSANSCLAQALSDNANANSSSSGSNNNNSSSIHMTLVNSLAASNGLNGGSSCASSSVNNRHRRTCSETFLVPDACLASSLSRSRRIQLGHKRLEDAATTRVIPVSTGRVSQRIAQLQQSLYASCNANPSPRSTSSHTIVARPLSIDPIKDYSVPLSVDCSIEYDLPRVAKPPPGAQPLLLIARRPTINNLLLHVQPLGKIPTGTSTFQPTCNASSHIPRQDRMTNTWYECGSMTTYVGGNNITQVPRQYPMLSNTVTLMDDAAAPVSSSSSDSGRGTDSERSPGSTFPTGLSNPNRKMSVSTNQKRPAPPAPAPALVPQMPWGYLAAPMDSGLNMDMTSWTVPSHSRSQQKQLAHPKVYPIRDVHPRVVEAAQQRLCESGRNPCQCCHRPQQDVAAKSAALTCNSIPAVPRWAPYSTHVRHTCPTTAALNPHHHHQHQHHQQQQQQQQHRSKEKQLLSNLEWNWNNISQEETLIMPRSIAFHV